MDDRHAGRGERREVAPVFAVDLGVQVEVDAVGDDRAVGEQADALEQSHGRGAAVGHDQRPLVEALQRMHAHEHASRRRLAHSESQVRCVRGLDRLDALEHDATAEVLE